MWARLWRRVRFGRPIVVVSGLPRSGTSMMMQMLSDGGLPTVCDGLRKADESNPRGYFEHEAVKSLGSAADLAWLREARGRGVKIVSPLLPHLPETHNYRVVFMQRPLAEVIASQNAMLARAGEPTDVVPESALTTEYEAHLNRVRALLAGRRCFDTLFVDYHDAIADPRSCAARVARFVGSVDPERMAAAIDRELHRRRLAPSTPAPDIRRAAL